ncbi:UNVERIFIED_CONTAM: hypothetical protein K2H54_002140 [Gekko kuhli]
MESISFFFKYLFYVFTSLKVALEILKGFATNSSFSRVALVCIEPGIPSSLVHGWFLKHTPSFGSKVTLCFFFSFGSKLRGRQKDLMTPFEQFILPHLAHSQPPL